jgi:hypothetical protein
MFWYVLRTDQYVPVCTILTILYRYVLVRTKASIPVWPVAIPDGKFNYKTGSYTRYIPGIYHAKVTCNLKPYALHYHLVFFSTFEELKLPISWLTESAGVTRLWRGATGSCPAMCIRSQNNIFYLI